MLLVRGRTVLATAGRGRARLAARSAVAAAARASSSAAADAPQPPPPSPPPPTAIVLLNMGGPGSLDGAEDGVEPFLQRLFSDGEIIALGPLQRWLGPLIARRRAPRIREQYAAIGGRSPIRGWTELQGRALEAALNATAEAGAGGGGASAAAASGGASAGYASAAAVSGGASAGYAGSAGSAVGSAAASARSAPAGASTSPGSSASPGAAPPSSAPSPAPGLAPSPLAPAPGPFKVYTAFRYAPPLAREALAAMAADGVTRAVAFAQYPHYSCTTTGSSLNDLWRAEAALGLTGRFKWSLIDRWPTHAGFVGAVARCVATGLSRWPAGERDRVVLLFTAHSVPMLTVNKGDQYVQEVAASVSAVVDRLRAGGVAPCADAAGVDQAAPDGPPLPPVRSPYILSWQSKVGFLPWMGPPTGAVLAGLGRQGHAGVLAVPIAFTSDHVETLYEIDVEYAEAAAKAGIRRFERAPSLNAEPLLTAAQAALVRAHVAGGAVASPQFRLNCAGCVRPECRGIPSPAGPYSRLRDDTGRGVWTG